MACMEHQCGRCGWASSDNVPQHPVCPKCGSPSVTRVFDEPRDYSDAWEAYVRRPQRRVRIRGRRT